MSDKTTKSVVITGASTGIGAACALELDRRGWRVFAGVRKAADGEALKAQASGRLTPLMIDVTDAAQIAAAADQVATVVGDAGLDGLVNNAGIAVAGPMEVIPIDALRRQMEVNFIGQVAVTQAFMPLLRTARGRVINMSSLSGVVTPPFFGPYAAAKHALEVFGEALRIETRHWGIKVIAIEPGSIRTPIWEKGLHDNKSMLRALPDDALALYGDLFGAMVAATDRFGQRGIPAERVARTVFHALTTRWPRAQYPVGLDAHAGVLAYRLLPTWLWEFGIQIGLNSMRNRASASPNAEVDYNRKQSTPGEQR